MIAAEKLAFYLREFGALRPEDFQELFALTQEKQLLTGDVYIKENTFHKKLCYVKAGMIRAYTYKKTGDEATLQLYWEDQFFASRHSVLFGQPSPYRYEAVEDSTLLEMDFDVMTDFLDARPQFASARTFFLTTMLAQSMERVDDFILLSPEERYLKLLQEKPDLNQRAPGKYIATILGITPVSLSRIRKRISSRR